MNFHIIKPTITIHSTTRKSGTYNLNTNNSDLMCYFKLLVVIIYSMRDVHCIHK